MSNKIPKYEFNNAQNLEFELTSIRDILSKSESELTKPHRQNFYGLYYFTNSFGNHSVDFKEYEIEKGTIFFISNEQVHFFKNIEKTKGSVLLFTNSFLENDFLIEQVFEQNIGNPLLLLNDQLIKDFELLLSQIKLIYTSKKRMKVDLLKKFLEIILLEIFQSNQEHYHIHNTNYLRFLEFKKDLKKHFKQEKSVTFYADKQFISAKTLNLAIRETVDKSAKQFISDYIILLAKRMLTNAKYSTTEIAYELGFDEPTNFVKFFKNKENATPSMFRKGHD